MKIGIYNLYWSTFGGGEQQAGGIADALSAEHEVELLGPVAIDLDHFRERLGLRLEGVTFRKIIGDEYAASLASADYEVFVNHTYRSVAPNLARHGIYFVMFPHPFVETPMHRRVRHAAGRYASPVRVLSGIGRDSRTRQVVVQGPTLMQVAPGVRSLRLELSTLVDEDVDATLVHPGASVARHRVGRSTTLEFELDGTEVGHVLLSPVLLGEARDDRARLRLRSVHADGVAVPAGQLSLRERLVAADQTAFLRSYQRVVALSDYTRGWTRTWWGRGDAVVSPPVVMREPGEKTNLILSVGRFFDERSGHSKRQLELVRAFRTLIDGGLTGWRLVLIGGCSPADREYAMAVRREAQGLPVEVRLSAPGAVLDAHVGAASIYWHAAGFGSDLALHPDRAEHFGIAPIEAMSAGAVPVVFGAGGPAEVVQHDVNGLHFHTIDELVQHTLRLVSDVELRARLSAAAVQRAHEYDRAHFEMSVRQLVADLFAPTPPTPSS
ncbi:MAG: glycosyltransferase family 4 protein [Actinomycetota bacterium]|nr:glycosyltransferase family 4 protein [Actinomycetota bacterium]